MPPTYEEYLAALEACLADKIIEHAEVFEGDPDTDVEPLFRWEINGLAIALRMAGKHGASPFDLAWATSTQRPSADWKDMLDKGYLSFF